MRFVPRPRQPCVGPFGFVVRTALTALISVALTACFVTMARADATEDYGPWFAAAAAATPTNDGALTSALKVADHYWGSVPCGNAEFSFYNDPGDWIASAQIGLCRIYIDRAWYGSVREGMRAAEPGAWRTLCVTVVHERGHTRGLTHDDYTQYPVMQPDPMSDMLPACNSWARDQWRKYVKHRGPRKGR